MSAARPERRQPNLHERPLLEAVIESLGSQAVEQNFEVSVAGSGSEIVNSRVSCVMRRNQNVIKI